MLNKYFLLLILLIGGIYGAKAQNCAVNAGIDQTICVGTPLTLTATSGLNFFSPPNIKWSQLSGPNTAVITSQFSKITTVTGTIPGDYYFKFIGKCIDGIFTSDIVKITVLAYPAAAQAGDDIFVCNLNAVTLNALPVPAPGVGKWTTTGTGTFSDINNPNSTYKPTAQGVYTLTWTASNGICSNDDMVKVYVSNVTTVNAGIDQTIQCAGTCATLNGSSPGVYPQTGSWTLVSGPSTLQFTDISNPKTKVCGLVPGVYVLQWNVSGPCFTGVDQMIITVTNINAAPTMGANKSYPDFCFSSGASSVIVNGTALLTGETGLWTLQSGPSTPTFVSPTNAVTTVNGVNVRGTYIFKWTKTTSLGCSASQTHTIRVESDIPALIDVRDTLVDCGVTSLTIETTFSQPFVAPNTDGVSRVSSIISKPVGSAVAIANGTILSQWKINNLDLPGKYIVRLGYSNSCSYVVQDVVINVSAPSGLINAGSDFYLPCGNTIANPQGQISNGATFTNTWLQISGPNQATLSNINSLSLMEMKNLIPGVYVMRLTSVSGSKCAGGYDDMKVFVVNAPPNSVNAGPDATVCYGNYQLDGSIPKATETGTWTVLPAGPTFLPDNTSPKAMVSGMLPNTIYTYTWAVTNSCGTIPDAVVITTTNSPGPNLPDAGINQCLNFTTSFPLVGNIPDTGVDPSWTALTAGSSISPTNTQNSTANITGGAGTYKFLYTLSKTGCTALSDTVIITIKPASFTINAGVDKSSCVGAIPASITLNGSAIPSGFTALWTSAGGPSAPTIVSPNAASTVVNNLQSGTYLFQYEIKGGVCNDLSDIVSVNISKAPTIAAAGVNQSICDVTTNTVITLTGNQPGAGETSYWSLASAPRDAPTPTFTNFDLPTATVKNLVQGTYVFRYNIQSGIACPESWDTMSVFVSAKANAGAAQTLCGATEMVLYGNLNTSGTWSYVSSTPAGLATPVFSVTGLPPGNARVTGLQIPTASGIAENKYTFRYTIAAVGSCPASTSDVVISNRHETTLANAGPDQVLCFNQNSITLTSQAQAPIFGIGGWRFNSGPSVPTVSGTYPSVTYSNLQPGIYIFADSINNSSSCPVTKDQVFVLKEVKANAGADTSVCASAGINFGLHGNYPSVGIGTWTQISGPSTLTYTNANNPYTQVGNWAYGTYKLKWAIVTSGCPGINDDTMQLIISQPITGVDAGEDQTFCSGAVSAFQIGSAPQNGITYSWSPATLLSNPNISNPDFIGVNSAGTYNYLLIANRGACAAYDALKITINPKPLANITWNGNGCSPVTFKASDAEISGSTYNWTFSPNATPPTAMGIGPHSIVYSAPGVKNASLVVTSLAGCSANVSVQSNGECFSLPIKLLSFTAIWKDGASQLNWDIASPINFSHFTIERSYEGKQFVQLYDVYWNIGSDVYSYVDSNVELGKVSAYYRLRLVDKNGNFEYSQVRSVKIMTSINGIKVIPNPFIDNFNILNTMYYRGTTELALIDVNGIILQTKSLNNMDSKYLWNGLENLTEGVYFVRIIQGNNVELQKIIKLK